MLLYFFKKSSKKIELSDQELLISYKKEKDVAQVGILFERYALQIYGICRGYFKDEESCQDAAMEMYEYLLDQLLRYDIDNFKHWLARATKNFCLMRIRKNSSEQKKFQGFQNEQEGFMEKEDSFHLENTNEISEDGLFQALDTLNEKQKLCIELFYLKKMSYEAVSSQTGFSIKEVKSFIQNGKRNLRIRLEEKNEQS